MAYKVVDLSCFNKPEKELNTSVSTPSYTHAYSVTTEYTKRWFLKKFKEDYFKHIWIEGTNMIDEFRSRKGDERLRIEKPRLVINPRINFDEAYMDNHGSGTKVIHYTSPYDTSFFKDYEKNIYLGLMLEELSIDYTFRIELSTKAQQLDLYKFMNMAFRVKYASRTSSDLDFHIPYHIMVNIAKEAGFEIKDNAIVDVSSFVLYFNAHSELPVVYKLRTVSQQPEFFVRYSDMDFKFYVQDLIQLDDGNKKGMINTDFNVEMIVNVKSIHPSTYIHYSLVKDKHCSNDVIIDDPIIVAGINVLAPDLVNIKGWNQYVTSEYLMDASEVGTLEPINIDFTELLDQVNLLPIVNHTNTLNLDPSVFIDLKIYNGDEEVPYVMDWSKCTATISNYKLKVDKSLIVVYADTAFIHTYTINESEINKSRFIQKEVDVRLHGE